ncbi:hypothetical protein BKA82DRAFT_1008041 [Pisolithus tinctorius]|uniref:WDR59/RTC1-like RING zinc finger domain-containing protein n=1 Tax=Pisolithus tinctorius Marx 270 TaxID=870435 RepID=A0A0C3JAQ5_PISTI|nr:hypothetical protein BKA82DRAFT_1008041 [Pisolithus tinctorius]KIN94756.1 hypothetical protein M404DRAFT_1008041 [Pisolithus tinctorius Marx 270]
MHAAAHRRSSTYNIPPPKRLRLYSNDLFSDSRSHGRYQGPVRNVHLPRTTSQGGGTIAKSEDGVRCIVAGRESLRILRLSAEDESQTSDHKSAVGRGGHRIEASRNLWDGSGLKIDSASTDVAWCCGSYNNKILTSARNGELIMWDLNKTGSTKYEMKTKNHVRSIHKLSCSTIVPYYCVTGSADGDMRVWDLRDMSRSLMRIHHPTSVRSLVFSPCTLHPLQAVVGLENGSMYRWDLQMGQRGQLDRLPVAHTGAVLSLDWCTTPGTGGTGDDSSPSMGKSWIVSGSLDHTVKVWDLSGSATSSHISTKPAYTLHPAYPVRRVIWRPDYPCELAVVSNAEFGSGSSSELMASPRLQNASSAFISAAISTTETKDKASKAGISGDSVEIWDVRRGWVAKWTVDASVSEGGVTDAVFRDSHAIWAQHSSGTFAQIDLRSSNRPIDAITRVALSWSARHGSDGALTFVTDKAAQWEVPYDDVHPNKRSLLSERKLKAKCLGDESRMPGRQSLGTYIRISPSMTPGHDTFIKLAKKYRVPEKMSQRKEVCAQNAEIAMQAGQFSSAQVWLVLTSLLSDVVPGSLVSSVHRPAHRDVHAIPLPRSISAPAVGSSTVVSYTSGSTSVPLSAHTTPSDPGASFNHVHAQFASPLQSVSQPRSPMRHTQGQQRTLFTSGTGASGSTPASNSGRSSVSKHQPLLDPSHPTKAPPNSRSHTPASSTTSSPRHHAVPLGPTPAISHSSSATVTLVPPAPLPAQKMAPSPMLTMTPRRLSVLGPAPPLAHTPAHVHTHTHPMHGRRPSVFSRSSTVPSTHSESPSVTSGGSLRHVGEGALDDSDSSDEGREGEEGAAVGTGTTVVEKNRNFDVAGAGEDAASAENQPVRPLSAATRSLSLNRGGPIHPSPLSRLAVQQAWPDPCTEAKAHTDSDEDGSPSPFSTDSEGARRCSDEECDGTKHHTRRARTGSMVKILPRKTSRVRSGRSRSSTVASLVAPVHSVSPVAVLSPVGSAVNTPLSAHFEQNHKKEKELTRRTSQSSIQTVVAPSLREREPDMGTSLPGVDSLVLERWNEMGDREKKAVIEEEASLHDTAWQAMRDALEEYADQGDIQMCAMLAIFAARELRIDLMRTVQFIEAYIDTLMRYQLHHAAAYIRKHLQIEDIRKTTGLETTIYTACGLCRKPILGARVVPIPRGAYAFCSSCRVPAVRCAICHLPVRTLLFQCSVCTHGGHQECYRRYYMERPMDPLPSPTVSRGRLRVTTDVDGTVQGNGKGERHLAGHPCAAGCGHFCWVAAMDVNG